MTVSFASFHDQVAKLTEPTLACFQKISKKYFFFHLAFALGVAAEVLLIGIFFSSITDSFFMGIAISLLFFTILLYFILRLYYHEQKPEDLRQLCNEYLSTCKEYLPRQIGPSDEHLALANSACLAANWLDGAEANFYRLPEKLRLLEPKLQQCSLRFHASDVQAMKELFLLASIEQHISLIRIEPTSIDAHAATANAYLMLAELYGTTTESNKKARWAQGRALEELKILSEFAPDNPWVHEKLAKSYQALKMKKQEIQEYEILLRLQPENLDARFTLGVLYFQEGENAKGLKIYEELRKTSDKAESLIQHYGSHL